MRRTKKDFYIEFIKLAVPIVGLEVLSTSVNLLSSLMVGQLGEQAIVSVGFCNQFFAMFTLLMYGICNGTAIFTSQYWGKKDFSGIRKMVMLSLLLSEAVAFVFFLICQFKPSLILGMFTENAEILNIGCNYIKIVSWNYLLSTAIYTCNILLKCVEKAKYALISSIVSIVTDISVSYLLIFGMGEWKGIGVYGAAVGICIAKVVELLLLLGLIFWKVPFMRTKLWQVFRIPKEFFPEYIHTVSPVILNMALYGVGTMLYNAVYGRTSTESVAAINIMEVIANCSKIFMLGAAGAASVIVGREIGAGKTEEAYQEGIWLSNISPVVGIVCSGCFALLAPVMIRFYNVSPEVKTITIHLMILLMVSIIFETCNHIGLVGVLKSGGDSFFNFVVDTIGVWGISLPLLFLTGILLHLRIEIVYAMSLIEIVIKSFVVRHRIKKCHWARNLVGTEEDEIIE